MAAASGLSARELDVLHAVAKIGNVTVSDWDKVAELAGMKTSKYARDSWAAVSKKLKAGATTTGAKAGDTTEPDSSSKSKPKTTPRKRTNANGADDEVTPSKKPKATPKQKGKTIEDGIDSPVKSELNEAGDVMDDILGQGGRGFNE